MSTEPSQPAELVARARAGDPTAIESLVGRHLGWLRSFVRARLAPRVRLRDRDSQDFVHDAIVSLLDAGAIQTVRDESHLRRLLARIVRNDLVDRRRFVDRECRAADRERTVEPGNGWEHVRPADSVTRPSQHLDRNERIAWVRLGLDSLSGEDRLLIRLRVWDGTPFGDIATALGVTEDAARMRCNRALARLAERIVALRGAAE